MREHFPYLSAKHQRWGRRPRLLFILFLLTAFFFSWKVPRIQELPVNGKKTVAVEEKKPKYPERIGEKIDYDVMLGKLRIGSAEYHNLKKTRFQDRDAYLISFVTRAVRFQDQETIYCDAESFLPLRVERKISQLLKPEYIIEEYDQEKFLLTITKKRFREEKTQIQKDSPIHNSILLPFFIRNAPDLRIGWSFEAGLPQKKYRINLKSEEKLEVAGKVYDTFYFESESQENDSKQIKIWVSADSERIPLKIEGTGGLGYKLVMNKHTPAPETKAGK